MAVDSILTHGLGYDRFEDITTEYRIKGDFADYALKINGEIKFLVEVKRAGKQLSERDIKQAKSYALNEGIEWVLLTDSIVWRLYHITGAMPVRADLVFSVSVLDDRSTAIDKLFYLSKSSLRRKQIDNLWRKVEAVSPESMRAISTGDEILEKVRLALKHKGVKLSEDEVKQAVDSALCC
jgi:predicted type IV restriction endonuclease